MDKDTDVLLSPDREEARKEKKKKTRKRLGEEKTRNVKLSGTGYLYEKKLRDFG